MPRAPLLVDPQPPGLRLDQGDDHMDVLRPDSRRHDPARGPCEPSRYDAPAASQNRPCTPSIEGSGLLFEGLLEMSAGSPRLRELVLAKAEGNPFFMEKGFLSVSLPRSFPKSGIACRLLPLREAAPPPMRSADPPRDQSFLAHRPASPRAL